MAKEPPNSLEGVRIDAEIGDDPAELDAIADAVVRGCSIRYARVKSLRGLIEAVQRHPDARLAPQAAERDDSWEPPHPDSTDALTNLAIYAGVIVDDGCYSKLDIRVTITLRTRFDMDAQFDGASFGGDAWFDCASFGGYAVFARAGFAGRAWFGLALFCWNAVFVDASFDGAAGFGRARFGHDARFDGANFGGVALFDRASFARDAGFNGTIFGKDAWFGGASFLGDAEFDDSRFGGDAWFGGTLLAGRVRGDLRPLFLRSALFADAAARLLPRRARAVAFARMGNAAFDWSLKLVRAADRLADLYDRLDKSRRSPWLVQLTEWIFDRPRAAWRWLRYDFGWRIVRALGQLQILNRISVIAIIAVPILAALTSELQAQFPRWPSIGHSLALAYFAAVFVTIGLLLYQVFAPDSVRKHDEDEFVELQHKRYPEGAEDRDDGLRRAIEHLEGIAHYSYRVDEAINGHSDSAPKRRRNAGRPDRHPNLVLHHGDTIWIPPRDRIDWFDDLKPTLSRAFEKMERDAEGIPEPGHTIVPGAERARIAIEEGAKAEYRLKSREKLGMAWASFACYLIGLGCLLVIVCLQANTVRKAAGWWPATSVPSIKAEANIEGQTPGAALDEQD